MKEFFYQYLVLIQAIILTINSKPLSFSNETKTERKKIRNFRVNNLKTLCKFRGFLSRKKPRLLLYANVERRDSLQKKSEWREQRLNSSTQRAKAIVEEIRQSAGNLDRVTRRFVIVSSSRVSNSKQTGRQAAS